MPEPKSPQRASSTQADKPAKHPSQPGHATPTPGLAPEHASLLGLQRQAGNRAVATTMVQRDGADGADAKTWATTVNGQVEQTQDAVTAAQQRLNAEAKKAIEAMRATQATYESYEKRYEIALTTFKTNVAAAQAAENQLREILQLAATFALAEFSPLYVTATKAVSEVTEGIEKAVKTTRVGRAGLAAKGLVKDDGAEKSSKDLAQTKTDWKALLGTALTSYQTNLDGNTKLTALSAECIGTVRFLGKVRDGTYGAGTDPRTTPDGQAADALGAEAGAIKGYLDAIGTGSVSESAVAFQQAASRELDKITVLELEQQIATRWIGSLGKDQLDEIDTAEAYLKQIKVIGPGSTLGIDTGLWTSDDDEKFVKMIADVENAARSMVGQEAEWLGRAVGFGPLAGGQVRDSHNRTWNVTAPASVSDKGGGSVTVTGYKIDKSDWDVDSWSWDHGGLQQKLYQDVTLKITPNGPTGGGALPDGPSLHAP